jgi:phosphotransferase system enzyme I (PtsI)
LPDRVAGTPDAERTVLNDAIVAARDELAALAARAEADAAAMLDFQIAMLEDPTLAEPAFGSIAAGVDAVTAWREALDAEAAGYLAAEDEYFRARAADLVDIRDRVLDRIAGSASIMTMTPGSVIVASDLAPSLFLSLDWSQGGAIVLGEGSPTSHVAMLARARGVPMVVGLGSVWTGLAGRLAVDGARGVVVAAPADATLEIFAARHAKAEADAATARARAGEPAIAADGTPVTVLLNVSGPDDLAGVDPAICEGIGLVRTEFLCVGDRLTDEEAQLAVYRHLLGFAAGRPVTIRTLDAGGDKPVPGYTIAGEANPFLGQRGLRLSLARPDVFAVQLRALARAAADGPVKIMLPMVTTPEEFSRAAALLDTCLADLARTGMPARRPPLGIMVEVPAAALCVADFPADFFSIGSNDLTQYVMAAARDDGAVSTLADPLNPAVLRLVAEVAAHGARTGKEVSLCGDAGGDPAAIAALLRSGLRTLSMAPSLVPAAKQAIRRADPGARP